MQSVAILRQLWRARLLVALGVAVALIVQTVMSYHVSLGIPPTFMSRQHNVGIASAGVLVDSHSSQVVDLGGGQAEADVTSLSARARLLANLMATSPLKDQIAARAGIPSNRLLTVAPSTVPGIEPEPVATGNSVSPDDPKAYILSLYVNEVLPIITAAGQAETPTAAARLSSAAVTELTQYLRSVAARDRVPDAQQLVVKPLGAAQASVEQRGPRRLFALAAFVLILTLWCAGIVVLSRVAKIWRDTSAKEEAGAEIATRDEEPRGWRDPPAEARAGDQQPGPSDHPAATLERPEYPAPVRRISA